MAEAVEHTEFLGARVDRSTLIEFEAAAARLRHSKSEAIREAIRLYVEQARGTEVVVLRDLPRSQARREVADYLRKRGRAYTGEIADALRLDTELVLQCLNELQREGKVE